MCGSYLEPSAKTKRMQRRAALDAESQICFVSVSHTVSSFKKFFANGQFLKCFYKVSSGDAFDWEFPSVPRRPVATAGRLFSLRLSRWYSLVLLRFLRSAGLQRRQAGGNAHRSGVGFQQQFASERSRIYNSRSIQNLSPWHLFKEMIRWRSLEC